MLGSQASDIDLQKQVICDGKGAWAKRGQKIAIHYQLTVQGQSTPFISTRDQGSKKPEEFIVGKNKIEGINLAVVTMKGGERATFVFPPNYAYGTSGKSPDVPPNATILAKIEFLYILEDMEKEDAKIETERLNTLGAEKFRSQKFDEAAVLYNEALNTLRTQIGDDLDPLRIKLYSNLSLVYSKLGKWSESLHRAEDVLRKDKKNAKATLRKLDAQIHLGRFDEAEKTLKVGLEITNNDQAFVVMRAKIDQARRDSNRARDDVYKRMAGK